MKRLSALLLLLSLFTLTAWTLEDCVEVDFDHPDCDQYTTTTTGVTPSSTTASTYPSSTTSTSGAENSTTTSIPTEQPTVTTTSTDIPTTTIPTTTIQQCPPGMIHQPPLCVSSPPTTFSTHVPDTTAVISPPAELPFTGVSDLGLLALAGVSLLFLGFVALRYGRSEE